MAASLARIPAGVPVVELETRDLQRLIGYPLDRGCVALVRRPLPAAVPALIAAATARPRSVCLVLENVSNPDNVGGLFRSAAAFGVAAIVLAGGCADPLYRKSVRTSLGNTLTVPSATAAQRRRGPGRARRARRGQRGPGGPWRDRPARMDSLVSAPCRLGGPRR